MEQLFQGGFYSWDLVGNILVILWKIRFSISIRAKALDETTPSLDPSFATDIVTLGKLLNLSEPQFLHKGYIQAC